jgi:MerR family transcriptional regulator, copper efflux regulator
MFIGDLAAAAGVSAQAIRLYERRGLLPPAERTAAGYRRYGAGDLELLKALRQCQRLGLTLAETRTVLGLFATPDPRGRPAPYAQDHDGCLAAVAEIGRSHLARTDRRIEALMAVRTELAETLADIENAQRRRRASAAH